jgi:tetratricopeptide (TPR) repeat protein
VLIDKLIKDQILDGPDLLVILPEQSSDFHVPAYSINVGPPKSIPEGL